MLVHVAQTTVRDIPPAQVLCLDTDLGVEVGMADLFLYQFSHCVVVDNTAAIVKSIVSEQMPGNLEKRFTGPRRSSNSAYC